MAEEPRVCDTKPLCLELEPGVHWWCACGRSDHPPFCDGNHKGTGIQPVRFETAVPVAVRWCQCKHTGTPPACDGSHRSFGA